MDTGTLLRSEDRNTRVRRVAGRAPVLPSARAALGALLCVAAALITVTAYSGANRPPTTSYLVATRDLLANAPIGPGDIRSVTMKLPDSVRLRAFTRKEDLDGTNLVGPLGAGELFQHSNVNRLAGGPGSQEMSFPIESAFAAGGRIRSGERIQVLSTVNASTEVLAANALVVNIDRADPNSAGGTLTITIAVGPEFDQARFAQAVHTNRLTVVRGPNLLITPTAPAEAANPAAPTGDKSATEKAATETAPSTDRAETNTGSTPSTKANP